MVYFGPPPPPPHTIMEYFTPMLLGLMQKKSLQEQETVEKTPLWNIVPTNPERGFTQVKIYAQEKMLLYVQLITLWALHCPDFYNLQTRTVYSILLSTFWGFVFRFAFLYK